MSAIRRLVTTTLTSAGLRDLRRARHRIARRIGGKAMTADFFFQVDDPYGPVALPYVAALTARYGLALRLHLVPAPEAAAAPELARLEDYGRRDAQMLADALKLEPIGDGRPGAAQIAQAQAIAAAALDTDRPIEAMIAIARACLSSAPDAALDQMAELYGRLDDASSAALLLQGQATRKQRGHYLSSTTHFEGEFYWGVDRLHYLEARLRGDDAGAPICPVLDFGALPPSLSAPVTRPRIDFYLSFRSPYTLVAAERIGALATAYGADLRLKFVLPMVMRGLPVPGAKRMYITLDTKREATRHGIPFGTIHDPVGLGVERGLAVLHHAIPQGLGLDFARSFLRAAFAEGIDMTSDPGLLKAAARAGINAETVAAALADPSWQDVAEANRTDLFALGLWGVPSFQVDDRPAWWGQDRLWRIEDDLRDALGLTAIDRTQT
ncbi:MAG: DsbA family protein [Sphingomonas sp.]|uniref:DsbA family protein n=1 Tax=Sphingomonas sp. TaxID=28214 RepID=UPI0035A8E5F4|nr:DsbA family protein [Sphingomonas sp.]